MHFDLPSLALDTPLVQRLTPRVLEVANQLLDSGISAVPVAGRLPEGHFADEAVPMIVQGCLQFLTALAEGRALTHAEVTDLVVPTVEAYAEDGISLAMLTAANSSAIQHLWREVAASARADEAEALGILGMHLLHVQGEIAVAMADVYADIEYTVSAAEHGDRRALCHALLDGSFTPDLARRGVAERYHVLSVQVDDGEDPADAGAELLARRRMRLAKRILDNHCGPVALSSFDGTRGSILIPGVFVAADSPVPDIIEAFGKQFDAPVFAGERADAAVADIPAAATETAAVAELVQRLHRPSGVYRIADVLFEYQVTRPGPARDGIAQLLSPLDGQAHLLETLSLHIKHGGDRKTAAAETFVHPNTFSYRLKRIAELTGIDPSTPAGSRLFAAALIIRRSESTAPA